MSSFGFGSNNTNNNSTFGGFGASNTGGFGSNNASTGGSLFGGNTATAGGFGGFGANNNNNSSPFGAPKPAFGTAATSGGGSLFGNNTTTSGAFGSGGGFGTTGNTTSGFGSNTAGGLFGQPKPTTGGFGANNTVGSLFGGGASTGGFGSSNTATTNPFGASTNSGFGANATTNTSSGFTFGGAANGANNMNNNSGTANTPFNAFAEKEPTGNSTSLYQSITFQQPYANKSFEELRTEDYAQGRRFGNSNGQAGSFGQSTGFGGFGATNTNTNTNTSGGGLFGANANTTNNAFGANTSNTASNTFGGFGNSNTNTGSLFGNKPAAGGLFGQQSSAATTGGFGSTASSGGGLFGNNNNTNSTSVFGNTNNTNNATSLFGSNNNQQQQNKPAFGGFGATSNTGGFGSTANTGTSLFGNNTNNATNTSGSLFGQQNNQQQSNPFGATNNNNSGGGLFGNQNKPAGGGLFGSTNNTNTGGSLFGAQPGTQNSNPFGQSTNTGGNLFGNLNQNQNKPATPSLFGNTSNTGGSGFGAQNNQNSGGSLFGNSTNTGGSLFGNNNKPAGTSLFGNNNASNNGNSLFGNTQGNQQGNNGGSLFGGFGQNQQTSNGNSLFGGNLNQSQPAQNALHTSLTGSPYGNEQLFSSLAAPSPPVGPLATPLSGAKPALRKTPSLLASARVNTPVYSPRGGSFGRNGGYGFTYSTYGTPNSAYTSGSLTPGASSLLKPTGSLSSALTSRLNKSLSTSNLRGDVVSSEGRNPLRPGAFSSDGTPGRYNSGNVRKLKIDRSLRTDLFSAEPKAIEAAKESDGPGLKKRVSFDNSSERETATPEATASNALVRTESVDDSPDSARPGPSKPLSSGKGREMEQVSNKTLTTVPEVPEAGRSSATTSKATSAKTATKAEVGQYWTKPSLKDLKNMSRQQLKNVGNFVVGREGVGRIEFGTVDLTNTPLEDIRGNVVQLNPRSATVYQDDLNKPAMGKALNVPSTIYLENSWPRSPGLKSGKEYDKHIARLKRVAGTHFLKYDSDTGVWSFKVEHFTTYGLDDDDEESELPEDSQMIGASSPLSDAPDTPAQPQEDLTLQSMASHSGEMEDTFQFQLDRRSQLTIPGGFEHDGYSHVAGDASALEDVEHVEDERHLMSGGLGDVSMEDPFISSGGPVQAPSPGAIERYHWSAFEEEEPAEEDAGVELPGSFVDEPKQKVRQIPEASAAPSIFTSPQKFANIGWEEQLNRTLSPRKRDRQALRDMQQSLTHLRNEDIVESPFKQSMLGQSMLGQSYLAEKSAKKARIAAENSPCEDLGKSQAFQNAMDLIDNLWPADKTGSKVPAGRKGFEYPHPKRPRLSNPNNSSDAAWHESVKSRFSNDATLIYSVPASWPQTSAPLAPATMLPIVGEHNDIRFAKFASAQDLDAKPLLVQKQSTKIDLGKGFPIAQTLQNATFVSLAESSGGLAHEQALWGLCSILYDPLPIACARFVEGIPEKDIEQLEPRIRLDVLGAFWAELIAPSVHERITRARNAEERALLHLTRNDITAACEALTEAKDFNLAMLVAQLPGSEQSRAMMKAQIEVWRHRNDWSEMSDAIRALYGLVAGELCVVEGKGGPAENRTTTFNIAERFNLTWQQSLALRLYFGGFHDIAAAIGSYAQDIDADRETVRPTSRIDAGSTGSDLLMEVLRLHAGSHDLQSLFDPLIASGSALNWRVTWQLASLLRAKQLCTLRADQFDQITYALASQFEAAGDIINGAWTMLHLQDTQARYRGIVALLERHGDGISTSAEGSHGTFEDLTQGLRILPTVVWRAKALYAKAGLEKPGLQTEWLLQAGDVDAAHTVLCSSIGPRAVIEQDYALLSTLLQHFENLPVDGWEQGGQVYADYLTLLCAHSGHRRIPNEAALMQRLSRGLEMMQEEGMGKKTLDERVAVLQMGKVLEQQGNGERMADSSTGFGEEADMLRKYRRALAA